LLTRRALFLLPLLALPLTSCQRPPAPKENTPAAQTLRIVMVPKLQGIDYFNACQKGAEEAARELRVTLEYRGPVKADAQQQNELINALAATKPGVIAVACNDASTNAVELAAARDRGIHVITWDADADATKSNRELFVNQATPESIGATLVDEIAEQIGGEGEILISSTTPTSANQNEWIKHINAALKKHPKIRIVDTQYCEEKQDLAQQQVTASINSRPGLKGVLAISSTSFPGAAEAVKQLGKGGQIAVVGLSTPTQMKPFVDEGIVKTVVLWNPVDLGYLTVHVAKAVSEGKLSKNDKTFEAGRLGTVNLKGDNVVLGEPMRFTKENIAQFDF
jgi:rhamnose transport system substrate-binding protein